VRTSKEIIKTAKLPWKNITLKGEVEKEFLYWTVLGGDIYPFSFRPRLVVLPAQPRRNSYRILDVKNLRNEGYPKMARWLETAQRDWEKYATEKSKANYPRIVSYINFRNKLTSQSPTARYRVVFPKSGKNLAATVISPNKIQETLFGIPIQGIIVEDTTYYYTTDDENEAHYLCAILNSDTINELVKPLQPKGSFGERHFHRRPLELPIPKFDPNNELHTQLAELSKRAHEKMKDFKFKAKSAGRRRKEAREFLKKEIEEINELVRKIVEL